MKTTEDTEKNTKNMEIKKILVADDELETLELLKFALEQAGYQVIPVTNGKALIEKAVTEKPDLLIVDLMMPQIDGFTGIILLRKNPELKDIPIIVSTGYEQLKNLFMLHEVAKIQDFIAKPFMVETLLDKIKQIYGKE
ncbi:MAG: response regulator [Elusimicrobiota bacterium]